MGGSGTRQLIATSGGCRTWPARFKCQWTSCAFGRYEAGFARGRSRLEVCGPSGPMGGNNADCGSSWQTRVRASLRNKRIHEEHYQFRHLDPLYPFYLDRGSSIVTKEVLCRADPGLHITRTRFLTYDFAALRNRLWTTRGLGKPYRCSSRRKSDQGISPSRRRRESQCRQIVLTSSRNSWRLGKLPVIP